MKSPDVFPAVWMHGKIVAAETATVSVFDRSFLYGDGLFETARVYGNRPFRWLEHLARLCRGAELLRLRVPHGDAELTDAMAELLRRNGQPESVLRLHLSRGVGRRGNSLRGADSPWMLLSQHPVAHCSPAEPVRWQLATVSQRVQRGDPLVGVKSANKLVSILARAEAEDRGADEALLLSTDGYVTETSSGNVFWVVDGCVCTPPLGDGILPGVTRAFVLQLAQQLGLPTAERHARPADLQAAEGVFLTLSSLEIVPVVSLDGIGLSTSPVIRQLHAAYREAAVG